MQETGFSPSIEWLPGIRLRLSALGQALPASLKFLQRQSEGRRQAWAELLQLESNQWEGLMRGECTRDPTHLLECLMLIKADGEINRGLWMSESPAPPPRKPQCGSGTLSLHCCLLCYQYVPPSFSRAIMCSPPCPGCAVTFEALCCPHSWGILGSTGQCCRWGQCWDCNLAQAAWSSPPEHAPGSPWQAGWGG